MKILVTGCAGFIGFHLTKRLLSEGHLVFGVDNLNDYYSPAYKIARLQQLGIDTTIKENEFLYNSNKSFCFIKSDIEADLLYSEFLSKEKFEVVCHLAAQAGVRHSIEKPQLYVSSNIQGFFKILEYCRYNPPNKIVFASSSSVYGKNEIIPYLESNKTESPVSLYAATKKSNELFAHCYSELYGLNVIGLRFFTVYGPWGRPDMAPFIFTKAVLEGSPIKLFNKGDMLRDFTYIDDITEGVYRTLIDNPKKIGNKKYRIYNLGNSNTVKLNDFIATIEDITGKKAHLKEMPMQQGDVKATWADISRIKQDYGYAPKTNIKEGLKEFIRWYENYYQ